MTIVIQMYINHALYTPDIEENKWVKYASDLIFMDKKKNRLKY